MHGSKSWIGLLPALGLLTYLAGGFDNAAKAGPGACEPAQSVPVCEPVKKIAVKACEPVKKVASQPLPKACEPVKSCESAKEQWSHVAPNGPVSLVLTLLDHVFINRVAKSETYTTVPQPEAPPVKATPAQLPPPPKAPTATTVRS
jgi:hypothetical protein